LTPPASTSKRPSTGWSATEQDECEHHQAGIGGERHPLVVFVELLGRIAARAGATRAQVALARVLARKPWIVPIPGTTKLHRLDLAAGDLEPTPDELREIDEAQIEAQGARYFEANQRMIDR